MSLKSYLDDVCPHCGNGSDRVVEYVKSHDNNPEALYKEAIALNNYQREDLIEILLTSDYNIFVPWYKKLLINTNTYTSKEMLMIYKKSFDEVPNMEDFE